MTKIKFAHLSDIHLGAWRNEKLNYLGYQALEIAIEKIIEENVDFVILSGNLYDISNPKVDVVDLATKSLKKLKDNDIPLYGIMGSHDFSPSDKSMIRPLITAELFTNVSQAIWTEKDKIQLLFTEDPKTQIKITGLRAKKRYLEVNDYKLLDLKALENERGVKIFVLASLIDKFKPQVYSNIEGVPESLLPKGFAYYAAGHLRNPVPIKLRDNKPIRVDEKNHLIYPGCLSPINFLELEEIQYGGFCIVSGEIDPQKASLKVQYIPVKVMEVESLKINCENKSIEEAKLHIDEEIFKQNLKNKIVTIRIFGMLSAGKTFEIDSNEIIKKVKKKGAYEVLINKSSLYSIVYEEPLEIEEKAEEIRSNEDIEKSVIKDCINQSSSISELGVDKPQNVIRQLLNTLGKDREEDMKVKDYKRNLEDKAIEILGLKKFEE